MDALFRWRHVKKSKSYDPPPIANNIHDTLYLRNDDDGERIFRKRFLKHDY